MSSVTIASMFSLCLVSLYVLLILCKNRIINQWAQIWLPVLLLQAQISVVYELTVLVPVLSDDLQFATAQKFFSYFIFCEVNLLACHMELDDCDRYIQTATAYSLPPSSTNDCNFMEARWKFNSNSARK